MKAMYQLQRNSLTERCSRPRYRAEMKNGRFCTASQSGITVVWLIYFSNRRSITSPILLPGRTRP